MTSANFSQVPQIVNAPSPRSYAINSLVMVKKQYEITAPSQRIILHSDVFPRFLLIAINTFRVNTFIEPLPLIEAGDS